MKTNKILLAAAVMASACAATAETVGDTAAYWQDPELGDPAFYEQVVKPAVDEVNALKGKIVPEMDDDTALGLGETLLPRLRDFNYEIDRLRTRYAAERRGSEKTLPR